MRKAIIAAIVLTLVGVSLMLYAIIFLGKSQDPEVQTETMSANEIGFSSLRSHNTADNCWIAFGGRVFNITRFLDAHPDEKTTLTKVCGLSVDALPSGISPDAATQYQIGILAP